MSCCLAINVLFAHPGSFVRSHGPGGHGGFSSGDRASLRSVLNHVTIQYRGDTIDVIAECARRWDLFEGYTCCSSPLEIAVKCTLRSTPYRVRSVVGQCGRHSTGQLSARTRYVNVLQMPKSPSFEAVISTPYNKTRSTTTDHIVQPPRTPDALTTTSQLDHISQKPCLRKRDQRTSPRGSSSSSGRTWARGPSRAQMPLGRAR